MAQTYSQGVRSGRRGRWGHWLEKRLIDSVLKRAEGIESGTLTVTLPGGEIRRFGGTGPGPNARLQIHSGRAVRRLITGGDLGFAESYIDGEWDTPDLATLIELGAVNSRALAGATEANALSRFGHRLGHRLKANNRKGSRRNIAAHYDLGNDFYAHWLDEDMTYSAAMFAAETDTLREAQERKYRALCEKLALKPHHHLLEIGCGWGGLAEFAAREYGCRVTALTLSAEQGRYARERIANAGLADRVEIRQQDYRDVAGRFDHIASIEMFEAVGEAWWPTFFRTLRARLVPEGVAAMQVITIADDRFEAYRKGADFIQRYIFPGGMLPSPSAFRAAAAKAGLRGDRAIFFGADYARTLAHWSEQFSRTWPRIRELGFDERFRRMWEYYFAYCRGGFRAGTIDVMQLRLTAA